MKLTTDLKRTPTPLLIWRFGCAEVLTLAKRFARRLGFGSPVPFSLSQLAIPDSALAKQATRLVSELSPRFLFNHAVRSYLFADALGRRGKLKYDRELLYLGAVMHDLGLTPQFSGPGSFEVEGARTARSFLLERGLPGEKADLVHEAIALHTAVGVASKMAPEVALVHFGSGMDVIGFSAEDIALKTIERVIEAYPRLGFKHAFAELLEGEAQLKPQSHIAGHVSLGFKGKINAAPFSD